MKKLRKISFIMESSIKGIIESWFDIYVQFGCVETYLNELGNGIFNNI